MKVIALDTEITTWNKGAPFDPRNYMVCYSWASSDSCGAKRTPDPTGIAKLLDEADLIPTFNGKFDLQWFVKEGFKYDPTKIWDCQLAHFILTRQTHRYPSLNEVAAYYNLPQKPDVVKEQYWEKGINTDAIPWEVLEEYATHDAVTTLAIYECQNKELTGKQRLLFRLQCQDLSLLREMEANGIPFDEQLCQTRAEELDDKISTLKRELTAIYPNVPINFGSNDHLSAFLYGGVVKEDSKEFIGFYKTGERAGQPKYKNVVIEHTLPRIYAPLKGSEMAKAGNYSVDEGTLRKLKGKRGVIDKLLELSKAEKLNGTYYKGLIKLRETMGWDVGVLHGNFNQVTAATGRLSSNKPNLQNLSGDILDAFISKYSD